MAKQKFGKDKVRQDRIESWAIGVLPLTFLFGFIGFGLWTFWHLYKLVEELEECDEPMPKELQEMYERKKVYKINQNKLPSQEKEVYKSGGKCWIDEMNDRGYSIKK